MTEHEKWNARRKTELVDEDEGGETEGEPGQQQRRQEQTIAGARERRTAARDAERRGGAKPYRERGGPERDHQAVPGGGLHLIGVEQRDVPAQRQAVGREFQRLRRGERRQQ